MMPTGPWFQHYSNSYRPVSILVLLDDAYRQIHAQIEEMNRHNVSILVLLDDAYRLIAGCLAQIIPDEFQSLFFWMMPTGPSLILTRSFDSAFQSLFFWMMPTGDLALIANPACLKFQSLFFWMMPTGSRQLATVGDSFTCFNPCSSG